jgi:hypothetical protein
MQSGPGGPHTCGPYEPGSMIYELRHDGECAPEIILVLGGLVAGNEGFRVRGGAGRGIDIDAAA